MSNCQLFRNLCSDLSFQRIDPEDQVDGGAEQKEEEEDDEDRDDRRPSQDRDRTRRTGSCRTRNRRRTSPEVIRRIAWKEKSPIPD